MKIAIIGGGGSGLITAYLLQNFHDVVVFEKQPILGGNIRTLNKNTEAENLPNDVIIENGVLGFHKQSYPSLHRLLDHLKVRTHVSQPTSALYKSGQFFPSDPKHLISFPALKSLMTQGDYVPRLNKLRKSYAPALRRVARHDTTHHIALEELIEKNDTLGAFIRSLASLAFSTPYEMTDALPASILGPYLKSTKYPDWTRVEGGVYAYIEAILSRKKFAVQTDAGDVSVRRTEDGVDVTVRGDTHTFDKVVLATTPGAVLNILTDADESEAALFSQWNDHSFRTIAHTDPSVYGNLKTSYKTPMDLFVHHPKRGTRGYNTYMNNFYDINPQTPYSFAYNLDHVIDKKHVLHVADHRVPTYTIDAMQTRDQIRVLSGHNNTYFAGAYLGNGLHEGAMTSALEITKKLGGLLI